MIKNNIIGILLVIMFGLSLTINAQDDHNKHKPNQIAFDENKDSNPGANNEMLQPPPPPHFLLSNIPNLTNEQSESIKKLQVSFGKSVLPIENTITEKEAKLKTLSSVENPDINAIYKLIEEIGNLKIQVEKLRASNNQEIRKLLNDEQRLAFDHRLQCNNSHAPIRK